MANQNDPNSDPNNDPDLQSLKSRIAKHKSDETEREEKQAARSTDSSNMAIAFRACSELIISIGLCGFLGYLGDDYLSTKPVFLIIGLLLGTGVGFMGVYRITNNMGMAVGYAPQHHEQEKSQKEANSGSTSDDDNDKK